MNVEESLRVEIRELRGTITSFSTTVAGLDATVKAEIASAQRRIDRLEILVTEMIEKLGQPPSLVAPEFIRPLMYALYGICILLGVIIYFLANGVG